MLSKVLDSGNEPDNETTPRKQGAAFLEKLYDILEDSTYEDCICWCDDGKSVLVKKVEEFSQVLSYVNFFDPLLGCPSKILQAQ